MTQPTPPAWVRKRDGSLVPFEPDKISRALFAASESLGRPDAFLARELTDGVVHFLATENETALTTTQLSELVVKVVRELGQPALAQGFADGAWVRQQHSRTTESDEAPKQSDALLIPCSPDESPQTLLAECFRSFSLRTVFARDLAAAHNDGLLRLHGLEAPFELSACVLGPWGGEQGIFEAIEIARRLTGHVLAIDGPEYEYAQSPERIAAFVRELTLGLRSAGLHGIVNLNCAVPPSWADDRAAGPLFVESHDTQQPDRRAAIMDELLDRLPAPIRINWHLSEPDFQPQAIPRLLDRARRALERAGLTFVFDRPRHAVPLAEGLDRRHPAVLLSVELQLPYLAQQVAGQSDAAGRFLQKLGSLARLALSAGVQKRDFLRRRGVVQSGARPAFLLDRAHLVLAPIGLDQVTGVLIGQAPAADDARLNLAKCIVERLRDVVREDGQSRHLEACLDGSRLFAHESPKDLKSQLQVAAVLHEAAELSTVSLHVANGDTPRPEQLAEWLRWTWKRTDARCVRIVPVAAGQKQMTFS
jgi:hypothetical protein